MRGVIELPAIAIFTVVAGALIVLFFVVLTQSQGNQAESDTQAQSLQYLDTLLKSAATARETATNITIIDDTMVFSCDESGIWFGYQNNIQLPIKNTIIFSPRKLSGGQLISYSRASDVPYRAMNILFLTTPEHVLYNNGAEIYEYPFETAAGIAGNPTFRTVFKDSGSLQPNDVIVKEIDTGRGYGTVTYYPNRPSGEDTVYYPTRELLYGALLSQDAATYNCTFSAYLDQLKFVNEIYRERARRLKEYAQNHDKPGCAQKYSDGPFGYIASLPDAYHFTPDAVGKFDLAIRMFKTMNEDLLRGDNCASIY